MQSSLFADFTDRLDKILSTISINHLVVGVSGGSDSIALLHLCIHYARIRSHITFEAVHVNHNLQPISAQWVALCSSFCKKYSVKFTKYSISVQNSGKGIEDAARTARTQCFISHMSLISFKGTLVLAHHAEDQLETILMRLCQGSGLQGLCGIKHTVKTDKYFTIRPLLLFSKSRITHYANENKLPFIDDPTNTDIHFSRNYIRNELLPIIQSKWPCVATNVARRAQSWQSDIHSYAEYLQTLLDTHQKSFYGFDYIHLSIFNSLSCDTISLLLKTWVTRYGWYTVNQKRLLDFSCQIQSALPTSRAVLMTDQYVLRIDRNRLFLIPAKVYHALSDERYNIRWISPSILRVEFPFGNFNLEFSHKKISSAHHSCLSSTFNIFLVTDQKDIKAKISKKYIKNTFQQRQIPIFLRPVWPWLCYKKSNIIFAFGTDISKIPYAIDYSIDL
ncbi:MAG: tRNA lysidine(34) synthetase TilS [Pseudomonadota bacterium]|nr:tRNA lysidine(34) synthetase TilS [Pseudomonadota bacterium]